MSPTEYKLRIRNINWSALIFLAPILVSCILSVVYSIYFLAPSVLFFNLLLDAGLRFLGLESRKQFLYLSWEKKQ